jgi:4-carboxymuconolactone decarboxylase
MSDDKEPSGAQRAFGEFAPDFVRFTDDVLFGEGWPRTELSAKDRSLVTGLGAGHSRATDQLVHHLGLAKENGNTETELKEAIPHIAFYAGWPRAMSTMTVAMQVFGE